jgi:hypothetical protein
MISTMLNSIAESYPTAPMGGPCGALPRAIATWAGIPGRERKFYLDSL